VAKGTPRIMSQEAKVCLRSWKWKSVKPAPSQCLVIPNCCKGHFGLESGCVIPSRPSHALPPLFAVFSTAWVEQGYHSGCPVL